MLKKSLSSYFTAVIGSNKHWYHWKQSSLLKLHYHHLLFQISPHKSCSFLWVICFSCFLKPEYFPPKSYGYFLLSFQNLFKYYFLKFPYSALFKMAMWSHIICSIPITQLSFPHIIYYFLICNIIDLFICLFLISSHPSQ